MAGSALGDARWRSRVIGTLAGAALLAMILVAPLPAGLTEPARRVAAVTAMMAIWWLGGVFPMAVTALVPLVVFPALGVATVSEASRGYAHPLLFLMLGGFVLGHAMERVGVHRRLSAALLAPESVRRSPRRVLLALMLCTGLLSGLISNTATMLMMLPLARLVGDSCRIGPSARPAMILGLAYSASIGGVTTLVGTPPNAVLAGVSEQLAGQEIGFGQWMLVGIPAAMLMLPIAWWVVCWQFGLASVGEPIAAPPRPDWTHAERSVLLVCGGALVAWLTRSDKVLGAVVVPGWGSWLAGKGSEQDAWVAVLAAIATFLIREDAPSERPLLGSFDGVERAIPWSVLLLLGGGFSLADAIGASGLTTWIAGGVGRLGHLPPVLAVGVVCLVVTFVTEVTSNTATAQIALPVLAASAIAAGSSPMIWMIPAALSASCAFMMPIATAPNAIAVEAGGVPAESMARAGLVLNLSGVVVLTLLGFLWVPLIFPAAP